MNRKYAMSTTGYAIILVIILGIIMIISAPMLADKSGGKISSNREKYDNNRAFDPNISVKDRDLYYEGASSPVKGNPDNNYVDLMAKFKNIEDQFAYRISSLEERQNVLESNLNSGENSPVSDKYICTIEGSLDEEGNVVPINPSNDEDLKEQKFVFVCEYRQ